METAADGSRLPIRRLATIATAPVSLLLLPLLLRVHELLSYIQLIRVDRCRLRFHRHLILHFIAVDRTRLGRLVVLFTLTVTRSS